MSGDPNDVLRDEEPATLPGMVYGSAVLHPAGNWRPPADPDAAATPAAVEAEPPKRVRRISGGAARSRRSTRETGRSLAAYAMYQAMPKLRRSLKLVAEQITKEEIAAGATPAARYEARLRNVNRTVSWWSTSFGWVKRAADWDADQEALKRIKQESGLDTMNENQATIAGGIAAMSLENVRALLEADAQLIAQYTFDLKVWQQAQTQLKSATTLEPPKRPSLFFGPTSLVNLAKMMLDTERIARGAATQRAEQQHTGVVDFVIQVKQQAEANSQALAQTPMGFPFAKNTAIAGTDYAPPDGETIEPPEDGVVDAEVVASEWADDESALDDGVEEAAHAARSTS